MAQKGEDVLWDRSYCSDDVAAKAIEPLSSYDQTRVSSLKQVQVIHRHGARSVASVGNCFGDYQVEMDCSELNEVIGSSTSEGDDHGTTRIVYDMGGNVYSGTCNTGQLLYTGGLQEVQNGKNLKGAYVGSNSSVNLWETLPDISSNQTLLYSTDYMRTRQSILHTLKGLFGYNSDKDVKIHSRDIKSDPWVVVHELCPFGDYEYGTLDTDWLAAQDEDYKNFASEWKDTFGVEFAQECWDHMASALCAEWPLPSALQNQSSFFFKTAINYGFQRAKTGFDSNYSTIFIKDVMQDIKSQWRNNQELGIPSLVIWSAHDITVGAWLHAFDVWDSIYPPFASMITIEFYDMAENETFVNGFRLTWQGKAITQNMPGCVSDSDICDLSVLLDKYPSETDWDSYCAQDVPSTSGNLHWDFALGVLTGVACCTAMVITWFIISKWKRSRRRPDGYGAIQS